MMLMGVCMKVEVNHEADMTIEGEHGCMHPPHPKLTSEDSAIVDNGIVSSMVGMIKRKFDAADAGRGIIETMKPHTQHQYSHTVKLRCFVGQQAGFSTATCIIAHFIAVESQSRAKLLPILGGA